MASEHLVAPKDVFSTIEKLLLRDGFDIVIDMENSKGSHVIDSVTGTDWLDFYTFFASAPFGMNHPKLDNEEFKEKIFRAAINKVANSDIYTQEMADFVKTFGEVAVPEGYNHVFFIDYGTLAVENTFKVAMDWKVQKLIQKGKITPGEAFDGRKGTKIMHFNEAFHGRSGYTLSVTNTNDPNKHQRYAKFTEWPRIINPKITFPLEEHLGEVEWLEAQAIKQIKNALMNDPDGIAAVIIETIQGEGGDNHFRTEFFQQLRTCAADGTDLLQVCSSAGRFPVRPFFRTDFVQHRHSVRNLMKFILQPPELLSGFFRLGKELLHIQSFSEGENKVCCRTRRQYSCGSCSHMIGQHKNCRFNRRVDDKYHKYGKTSPAQRCGRADIAFQIQLLFAVIPIFYMKNTLHHNSGNKLQSRSSCHAESENKDNMISYSHGTEQNHNRSRAIKRKKRAMHKSPVYKTPFFH